MGALTELDVAALGRAYAGGLDPVAVTAAYLARIAGEDGAVHSYIRVTGDLATSQATASRERWRMGRQVGPLDGVPFAVKDNIAVAGVPCTAGTAAFAGAVAARSATVIERLLAAGAVLLGTLNMHEAALGATTDNPVYGQCQNPRRPGYTPGGSSGGSGAAVAASLCAFALGTDTLGSVRIPASYCGVWGFKPSNDAIETEGVVPLSVTLDSVGLLARNAGDIALVARGTLAPPARCGHAVQAPAARTLRGLRLGRPAQASATAVAPAVAAAYERFLGSLAAAGAAIIPLDLAAWDPGAVRRAGLLISEAEGYRYYRGRLGPDLPGLSPGLAGMLRHPARAGHERLTAAYAGLEAVRDALRRAFHDVDLIALPTTPQTSFPHGGAVPGNQADMTALANVIGAPAVSLPVALSPLPIGMQVLAPPGADAALLQLLPALDVAA